MELKKQFTPSIQVDFSAIKFYQIPFAFFAEWLYLVVEISKIIQPGFQVDVPKKQLDWFNFPDKEVYEPENGASYILRTASALLTKGEHTIHVLAQYGYETIPGQYIIVKSKLTTGSVFSRNLMKNSAINFEITSEEKHLAAIEEVFYIFQ